MSANDDRQAQLELEARLCEHGFWRVFRAVGRMLVCDVPVEPGWYYALTSHAGTPPVVAETLEDLERLAMQRIRALRSEPVQRSLMRELLAGQVTPEQLAELETYPGWWNMPGTLDR